MSDNNVPKQRKCRECGWLKDLNEENFDRDKGCGRYDTVCIECRREKARQKYRKRRPPTLSEITFGRSQDS